MLPFVTIANGKHYAFMMFLKDTCLLLSSIKLSISKLSIYYVQINYFLVLLDAPLSFQSRDVEKYIKLSISCKTRLYNGFTCKVGEQMDFCSCDLNEIKLELDLTGLNCMVLIRSI